MTIYQQYYTSFRHPTDAQRPSGFGVKAESPGMPASAQGILRNLIGYHMPRSLPQDAVAEHPIAFRYYGANGFPISEDSLFDLPLGFKWNAGLPMNFNNPERAANRYSSTRAMVVDDGRCFMFSTAVYENLGQGWMSQYGTDQYLTCRDAFNGRLLWRKRVGDTYYGGLYIENMAPLISTGHHLYLAGENGKMLKISTTTGETVAELGR